MSREKDKAGVVDYCFVFAYNLKYKTDMESVMRNIDAKLIEDSVAELCVQANMQLPDDVRRALKSAGSEESYAPAKRILALLEDNVCIADEKHLPVCQDTGMACVFIRLGQEVHITGSLNDAVNNGVRRGYGEGYLRKSVVADPLRRVNTGDNTPALINIEIVPGEVLDITVMPKGFGSENMSALKMLKPADGVQGVEDFVVSAVENAGANPCPPIVVGVGIGGTFDKAAALAKHALLRPLDEENPDEYYAELEKRLLERINALGIGPQGFGGKTTALAVIIETSPTHVAGLPVAVNISCHATRRASISL